MADWDASDEEASKGAAPLSVIAPKPPVKKKWADEDESSEDEVASDWEESEEEKPAPPKKTTVSAPPAVPKKKPLKQRLAEKEAAKKANGDDYDTEDDMLDPAVKKRMERERELEADLANAADLLQGASIATSSSNKDVDNLLKANPKTKDELVAYADQVLDIFVKRLHNKPLYGQFVEHAIRELARPLKDVDVRKSASVLTALANEKQKEQREGAKKKKTKPALGAVKSSRHDTKAYDESLDDFGKDADDFM